MASYDELSLDWNCLFYTHFTQWTKSDLKLAAELGKTLLERNKELETTLKNHQSVIDDQAQEIDYLQKQTAALREVNESRIRIYEQLEVSVQDLERVNHRLTVENTNDKKRLKSLLHNIEYLELRCEELNKGLEDAKKMLSSERRKNERLQEEKISQKEQQGIVLRHYERQSTKYQEVLKDMYEPNLIPESYSFAFQSNKGSSNPHANSTGLDDDDLVDSFDMSNVANEESEELIRLKTELETTKKAMVSEQQRVAEFEDQLVSIIQENQTLQARIAQTSVNEEIKSVHDELSILDEVQLETRCSGYAGSIDNITAFGEGSYITQTEGDDDQRVLDFMDNTYQNRSNSWNPNNASNRNSYHSNACHQQLPTPSLIEELKTSGEYNSLHAKKIDDESPSGQDKTPNITLVNNVNNSSSCKSNCMPNRNQQRENYNHTPTEFSNANNKATQTDERHGNFLCSIGDGEDCKFSIYDVGSPIDSRYHNKPEYRKLFKEIFAILKKSAENKEEGEKLTHPAANKSPTAISNTEEHVDRSNISSAICEQSVLTSECITKTEGKTANKYIIEKGNENKPPPSAGVPNPTTKQIIENGRILTPLKREPFEYLRIGVGIKKKNRKKNRNPNFDHSDSPVLSSPTRIYNSSHKKRRALLPINTFEVSSTQASSSIEWNSSSTEIFNGNANQSPTSFQSPNCSLKNSQPLDMNEFAFMPSTASQDLHKLINLDLSYAEVLRQADATCKHHH